MAVKQRDYVLVCSLHHRGFRVIPPQSFNSASLPAMDRRLRRHTFDARRFEDITRLYDRGFKYVLSVYLHTLPFHLSYSNNAVNSGAIQPVSMPLNFQRKVDDGLPLVEMTNVFYYGICTIMLQRSLHIPLSAQLYVILNPSIPQLVTNCISRRTSLR